MLETMKKTSNCYHQYIVDASSHRETVGDCSEKILLIKREPSEHDREAFQMVNIATNEQSSHNTIQTTKDPKKFPSFKGRKMTLNVMIQCLQGLSRNSTKPKKWNCFCMSSMSTTSVIGNIAFRN